MTPGASAPRHPDRPASSLLARTLMSFLVGGALAGCTKAPEPRATEPEPAGTAAVEDGQEPGAEKGTEGDEADLPAAPPRARSTAHGAAALAAEAARQVAAMKTSAYTHHTSIEEASGRFDYDCSGFVDYSLSNAAPEALAELRAATVRRPLAKHFVAFFSGNPGAHWRRVTRVVDLVPGDVLAWLKPADVTSNNTGHVLVVREPPHRDAKRADEIVVPIYDSTSVRHGLGDSRSASHATGLGTGEVLLIVDPAGAPLRYRWSRGSAAREHVSTIAMGHLL